MTKCSEMASLDVRCLLTFMIFAMQTEVTPYTCSQFKKYVQDGWSVVWAVRGKSVHCEGVVSVQCD